MANGQSMGVSTDSSDAPVVGGTRQLGGCQSAGAPNNETLISHDGRCGSRTTAADNPQGVDEGKKNAKLTSEDVLKKRGWE